jgi:predicted transcriptional regulator
MDEKVRSELLSHTAQIVAGYASKHAVDDLPALIRQVFDTLTGLGEQNQQVPRQNLQPAVPVSKSVMPDYIICLEDGKKMKMLKRYLKTAYKMTPDQYRQRWGLPSDYPMVAPNYAQKRSHLAKEIGLGREKK